MGFDLEDLHLELLEEYLEVGVLVEFDDDLLYPVLVQVLVL